MSHQVSKNLSARHEKSLRMCVKISTGVHLRQATATPSSKRPIEQKNWHYQRRSRRLQMELSTDLS